MSKRWVLGIAAVIVALAVGGVGYAAYTSSVTVYGGGSSGNLALAFDYGYDGSGTYAQCVVSGLSGNTVHVTASDLSPGDGCTVTLGVINNGTLPATSESTAFGFGSGSVCNAPSQKDCILVSDNLGITALNTALGTSGSDNKVIAASGGLYPGNYLLTISEPAGSTSQSLGLSFTVTFTGSVG
jgi:hypothetical protein